MNRFVGLLVVIIIIFSLLASIFQIVLGVIIVLGGIYLIYYCTIASVSFFYFKSKKFLQIKENVKDYVRDCNELNEHIEDLKKTYVEIKKTDYGNAEYSDNSIYHFKRPELEKFEKAQNIYHCSLSVCRNAQAQPFKYICKYFNIKPNEESLSFFENVLNNFSASEEGKILLKNKKDEIIQGISKQIPFLIKTFRMKMFTRKLGFIDIDFSQLYFPTFLFQYVSAGGNSSMNCNITFDIENLNGFINYLSNIILSKNSIAGQRALMTSALREKIKQRDNYTCRICGLSIRVEPNLLLEIDHIIPLSKNGLTTEDNLQTLCWKCNRHKGNKL